MRTVILARQLTRVTIRAPASPLPPSPLIRVTLNPLSTRLEGSCKQSFACYSAMTLEENLKKDASPPSRAALCGVEISKRPPKSWAQLAHGVVFLFVFFFACCMIQFTQNIFVVPLGLLPFKWAKEAHEAGVRYTKGAFGVLISEYISDVLVF